MPPKQIPVLLNEQRGSKFQLELQLHDAGVKWSLGGFAGDLGFSYNVAPDDISIGVQHPEHHNDSLLAIRTAQMPSLSHSRSRCSSKRYAILQATAR